MAISLEEVRRRILIGLFSDDELMDALVLKGGNALTLIHHVGSRASLDMDFSLEAPFANLERARKRIFDTLQQEFGSIGYVLFDEKLEPRPSRRPNQLPNWWGGYIVEFKLATRALYDRSKNDFEALRREAEVLGPHHMRKYTIDISYHEFCEGKVKREIDDYSIYVYSLEMIAIEKLRAICQQMPSYTMVGNKRARARDFYDIHQIIAEQKIDLSAGENLVLITAIFEAKKVPLDLLAEIQNYRDYHAQDWPAVLAEIAGTHESFDHYFDFVAHLGYNLKILLDKTGAT
jgi:predicted nucleotidyltransferase component of viral defense system